MKSAVSLEPLDWSPRSKGADQFRVFCERFLRVPRGAGALSPLVLRDWQVEALRDVFESPAKIHMLAIPRGNGKSALVASLSLFGLIRGGEGARVVVVAQNEDAARRLVRTAARMVELSPELSAHTRVYKDRLEYPATDSSIIAVASEQAAIEGEDIAPYAIIDELSFVNREVYETVLASLKRKGAKLVAIGTPPKPLMADKTPFLDLLEAGRTGDPDVSLVEYKAPDHCRVDDWEAIQEANPALGDFLDEDSVRVQMPPKITEAEFRRLRLGQFVAQSGESFMPFDEWERQARPGVKIPPGTEVVLGLDGSRRWDATALVMCSVSPVPHLEVAGFWWNKDRIADFEVSHLAVEERIRELARTYRVRELVADPWGWSRSLQVLEDEGINVAQFPQTGSRFPKALQEFRSAVLNKKATHNADPHLAKHMRDAQLVEGAHGLKLAKPGKAVHIDLVVASVMAYSRAFWLASKRNKRKRVRGYQT